MNEKWKKIICSSTGCYGVNLGFYDISMPSYICSTYRKYPEMGCYVTPKDET